MILTSTPLVAYTINLDFAQIQGLVMQMPDEQKKLIYDLLKPEVENQKVEWISKEILDSLPEDDNISDEEFYESLKQL
jgi:glutamate formiminotransferase